MGDYCAKHAKQVLKRVQADAARLTTKHIINYYKDSDKLK